MAEVPEVAKSVKAIGSDPKSVPAFPLCYKGGPYLTL